MSKKIRLNQNQFANICEMMAYHGTGAEFDKFNHKKYLNTGAMSQSFGWGTYVTNDKYVALGYSRASKDHMINMTKLNDGTIDDIVDKLMEKYGISENEAYDFVEKTIRSYENDFDQVVSDIDWIEERLYNDKKLRDSQRLYLKMQYDILFYLKYKFENQSFLYQVDIPEDNGTNYIDWYNGIPSSFMRRIIECFLRLKRKQLDAIADSDYPFASGLYGHIQWINEHPEQKDKMIGLLSKEGSYNVFFGTNNYTNNGKAEGRNLYLRLSSLFGSKPKAASLFLMQCGFDGIKYPSGTIWRKPDGAGEDAYNYVVFDSNKVKIIKKERV